MEMTIGGWISMTLAIGATTGLLIWCCWKITTTPDVSSDGADGADGADDE